MRKKNWETTYLEEADFAGNKIPSVRYRIFRDIPFVKDGFSTRRGGVSKGIYESMNFSIKMGDTKENVRENFKRFTQAHGFLNPVMTDQVHGTVVRRVAKEDAGKNVFLEKDYEGVDAFITSAPGLTLVTTFADCVPLYFVDEENRCIGLAHSGWRGTIQRIGREVIRQMEKEFGSRPETLKTAIGPSICVDCYEVSRELADNFAKEFHTADIIKENDGRYYLDLWKANRRVLEEAGVRPENIAMPDICTCCNPQEFFSHRASHGKRGNLCAFLMIKQEEK